MGRLQLVAVACSCGLLLPPSRHGAISPCPQPQPTQSVQIARHILNLMRFCTASKTKWPGSRSSLAAAVLCGIVGWCLTCWAAGRLRTLHHLHAASQVDSRCNYLRPTDSHRLLRATCVCALADWQSAVWGLPLFSVVLGLPRRSSWSVVVTNSGVAIAVGFAVACVPLCRSAASVVLSEFGPSLVSDFELHGWSGGGGSFPPAAFRI